MQVREPVPVESEPLAEPVQVQSEPLAPVWGQRASLWQWLAVIGASAVFLALFHRLTADAVATHGHDAFPGWLWDLYDWRVWPLSRFR